MMRSESARRTLSPTVGPNICAYAARCIVLDILRLPRWASQWSHHRFVEAINQACARVRDQPTFTRLAWLEAHSCSRRNVQAISKRSLSIESESCVRLGEMIVTADLDRSVARVRHSKRNRCSILIKDNLSRCWKNLARYHISLQSEIFRRRL